MKHILLIPVLAFNFAHGMDLANSPRALHSHKNKHSSNVKFNHDIDSYRQTHNHSIDIMSPEVQIAQINADAQQVHYASKKKIAAMVLAGTIAGAVITGAVTLTIHFTHCQ